VSTALKRFLAGTALAAMAFTASPAHAQTRSVSPPGDPSFPPAGQWVQIESDSSGLCLAARDGAGGAVVLDDCAPRAGQYWSVSYHADGSSRVHNRATGMCLDVDGKPAQPNEGAVQRPCGIYGDPDSANQWWNLYRFGDGTFGIAMYYDTYGLAAGGAAPGAPAVVTSTFLAPERKWKVHGDPVPGSR
jgi:hypothetical protein